VSPDPRLLACVRAVVAPALREKVTADSRLGALGVDSIGSMQLLMSVEDMFGVTFPDETLDEEVTESVAALWAALRPLLG
jgi:acyl carrier protein